MAWTAHQLVILRISPAALALAAIVLALATTPLLHGHHRLLAVMAIVLYRLLSMLSGWVSRALGHLDARQRYLRPFMEIILMLSVVGGLSLYSPERLFWPALALIIVVPVFDFERRLAVLLQEAQKIVPASGKVEHLASVVTGSAGRTVLLMAACYWPPAFFWSGFGFAGICLTVLTWRLWHNYRQLGTPSHQSVSVAVTEHSEPGMI